MTKQHLTQQALSDIALLKKALTLAEEKDTLPPQAAKTRAVISCGSLSAVATLTSLDLYDGRITSALLASAQDVTLQQQGLSTVGIFLALLVGASSTYIYIQSKQHAPSFGKYTTKHFAYFKNLSIISDIAVKFAAFAMVILAQKPEWIAPLLSFFMADAVFQGRLFTFRPALSIASGIACYTLGIYLFTHNIASVAWPLATFTFFNTLDVIKLLPVLFQASKAED